MDRGVWRATVHGDTKSRLSDSHSLTSGKEHMALAWVAFYWNLSSHAVCAKPSERFLLYLQASTAPGGHFFLTLHG